MLFGCGDRIRTYDLQVISLLVFSVEREGFEIGRPGAIVRIG